MHIGPKARREKSPAPVTRLRIQAKEVDAGVNAAVQNNTTVPDAKLNALVTWGKTLCTKRGYPKEGTVQKLLAAGPGLRGHSSRSFV
jgi:hypothetical protein